MKRPKDAREKIFDVFATNLTYVKTLLGGKLSGELPDGTIIEINQPMYICPLCLKGYTKVALDQNFHNPLTLEDVPPKSLGGKPLLLTCKECNSKGGYLLDSVLKQHLQSQGFLKLSPGSKVAGKVSVNKLGAVKSIIEVKENKELFFHVDGNNYLVRKHISELQTSELGGKVDFTVNIPSATRAGIAILKIGYLLSFNYLGNLILLSPNIEKIVRQINNPDQKILPHTCVTKINKDEHYKEGLYLLTCPANYRSFFVAFSLKIDGLSESFGVFLPGPGEDGWRHFENIKNLNKKATLSFKDVTFNDMVTNKDLVDGYHYLWKNL
jgi:hypothetical protein